MADRALEQQQQFIRLPLYSHEDQRIGNVGGNSSWQMQDQMLVNCYPIIAKDPLQGDKPVVKIQRRLGWDNPERDTFLNGIITNLTTAYCKGVLNMSQLNDVLVVCYVDGTNFKFVQYRALNNTAALLGTVAWGGTWQADDYVHMSEVFVGAANTPTLAVTLSSRNGTASAGYFISAVGGLLSGGAWTNIGTTDPDYPPGATYNRKAVGPMVQLNNVIYQMTDTGWIHGSEPDGSGNPRIDVWNSLGKRQATSYPDKGLGLARYKHHLIAIGEETLEFFNDEGLAQPALPIARTDQAFIKIGAINQKAYINIDDVFWFVGKSTSGHVTLYKLDGYTPQPMGQPPQQTWVNDRPYNIDLQVVTMHSMRHLIMNERARGSQWFNDGTNIGDTVEWNFEMHGNLCYCIDTGTWWLWALETDDVGGSGYGIEKLYSTVLYTQQGQVVRVLFSDIRDVINNWTYGLHPKTAWNYWETTSGSGNYDGYRVNDAAVIDPYRIPMMVVTRNFDFESNNRKFIRAVRVIGDHIKNYNPGTDPFTAYNAEGLTLNLGMTRTDGLSGSDTPEIKRGKPLLTQTEHRYHFPNFGACRQCRFWISINSYVPVRLEALELHIAQGTH